MDAANKLVAGVPVQLLCSHRLRNELNHLLWIQAFDNRGTWDYGWSCRDHAFVAGIVAQLLGLTVELVNGEALFVREATEDAPGLGLHQKHHTWLAIEGDGVMDFSIRFSNQPSSLGYRRIEYVASSTCRPAGTFLLAETQDAFGLALAAAPTLKGEHAIYRADSSAIIDQQLALNAFAVINSPLTVRLSKKYSSTIYAKLAMHSFDLLCGAAEPLTGHQPEYAWKKIARLPDDAIARLAASGGLR